MCCGRSDGTPRPATSYIVFQVLSPDGDAIGEPWPSYHEARMAAAALGPKFRVETRRD